MALEEGLRITISRKPEAEGSWGRCLTSRRTVMLRRKQSLGANMWVLKGINWGVGNERGGGEGQRLPLAKVGGAATANTGRYRR